MNFKSPTGEAAFLAAYDAALAAWPVPYETLRLPTRFGTTHVISCGPKDGAPLVLLHGAGTSSTIWIRNIEALSRTYRTYLVDIVGDANKSEWLRPFKSRLEYALWFAEVLDGLGVERAHVGGLSFGGWQSLSFALAAPHRVASTILLAPAASFVRFPVSFFLHFLPILLFPTRERVAEVFRWMAATRQVVDERLAEQMYLGVKHFKFPIGAFPDVFTDDELRSVTVPTLLLIGDQEVIYSSPVRALDRAKRLIPHIQAELVPDASHLLIMEQADLVNQRMLGFLRGVSPLPVGVE